jgi:hypothetical protein
MNLQIVHYRIASKLGARVGRIQSAVPSTPRMGAIWIVEQFWRGETVLI